MLTEIEVLTIRATGLPPHLRASLYPELPGGDAAPPEPREEMTPDQRAFAARIEAELVARLAPTWIVNDLGELGVELGGRFFFLYKGDNLEYGADGYAQDGVALHEDGTPMQYRMVGKREFGETCLPEAWIRRGFREDRYTVKLAYTPGLSFGKPEDGDWKPLPAARSGSEELDHARS